MKHLTGTADVLRRLETRNYSSYALLENPLKALQSAFVRDLKGSVSARGYKITTEGNDFEPDELVSLSTELFMENGKVEYQFSFDFHFSDGELSGGEFSISARDSVLTSRKTDRADEVLKQLSQCLKGFDAAGFNLSS